MEDHEALATMRAVVSSSRQGARARAKEQVEERLRNAAVELFVARGYDDVTVTDIADSAGVSSRTFFRYFPSKETVVVDITDHTNGRLVEIIRTSPHASSVSELLEHSLAQWFTEFRPIAAVTRDLAARSDAVKAAFSLRERLWTARIGDAIGDRLPACAPAARTWGLLAYDLMRLAEEYELVHRVGYDETLRRVTASFVEDLALFAQSVADQRPSRGE